MSVRPGIRKTGSPIAFVSGRSGLPQIYTMESDGTERPADDRSGMRGFSELVAKRAISRLLVDAQVRSRQSLDRTMFT